MPQKIQLEQISLAADRPLVSDVSFTLRRGQVLALLGSSGCGKSLTCAAALGLLPPGVRQTAGRVLLDGIPVHGEQLRGATIATIMQNPRSAFNPLQTMAAHAWETCRAAGRETNDAVLLAAMEEVGLDNPRALLKRYPFEMSGGMLQRMMVALALLSRAPFIIADEPTTDLDAIAQARILDLLADIVARRGLGLLLVTHDMGVVARLAHHVTVMENGRLVEHCDVNTLFSGRASGVIRSGENTMNLLSATGVSHDYPHHGRVLHAIHLAIAPGETVALLGRSGCGKSTLARMLVGLETPQHGDIAWRGAPLAALKGEAIGAFRRDIQLVFQDAFSAVNPRKTVREIVSEPLRHLLCLSREARARRVEEMLLAVDLASSLLDKRPAQLSGGQLQRVCLARALAVRPQLLILDEAVSNLDLLLQAEIIALLKRLQAQFDTACLFITHDLRLVERFCHRVLVMEHGRIVETATVSLPLRLRSPAGQALQQAVLPPFPATLLNEAMPCSA